MVYEAFEFDFSRCLGYQKKEFVRFGFLGIILVQEVVSCIILRHNISKERYRYCENECRNSRGEDGGS